MIATSRVVRAGALALAGALAFTTAASAALSPPRLVTLRNGLRVLLAPDSLATTVDVSVWYPCGTRWERPGESGSAALTERLLFRGSAQVPDGDHVRRVREAGGVVGTLPVPDDLCVYETIPPGALDAALRLEADRMAGLRATAVAIEEERTRLRDQHARVLASVPAVEGLERMRAVLFPDHPYGTPLLGTPATVRQLKAADVAVWSRARLGPSGAVLALAGRFDAEPALARVRELFESIPRRGDATPPAVRSAAPRGPFRVALAGRWPARILLVGWRGPGAGDPSAPTLELLTQLLGVGPSSRLRGAVAGSAGPAGAAQGNLELRRDASLLWLTVSAPADADSAAIERDVLDTVARIAQEPPSPEELSRASRQLQVASRFAQQTARARAQALGDALWLTGDAANAEARYAALDRVTPEDVRAAAARVLTDANRATVWIAPAPAAEGAGR